MKKYILSALLLFSVTQLFSQRNIVEEGPFKPFGGKKETKYSSSKQPLEIKEFDVDGNLRRHILKKEDSRQRMIETIDEIYDFKEKNNIGRANLNHF